MENKQLLDQEVGAIVATNFHSSEVFLKYGIDFCCHGNISLRQACMNGQIDPEELIKELNKEMTQGSTNNNFSEWPLDLLIDYVLKIHHRGIRNKGPQLLQLIEKAEATHGMNHPELAEIKTLFQESLVDLDAHLQKEENVLFPYLLQLFEAAERGTYLQQMHCGTVANPIRVMKREHEGEGNRYHRMTEITNNFTAPADGCNSYQLMMGMLKEFVAALYEHIHLENNIIFPQAVELEQKWVR